MAWVNTKHLQLSQFHRDWDTVYCGSSWESAVTQTLSMRSCTTLFFKVWPKHLQPHDDDDDEKSLKAWLDRWWAKWITSRNVSLFIYLPGVFLSLSSTMLNIKITKCRLLFVSLRASWKMPSRSQMNLLQACTPIYMLLWITLTKWDFLLFIQYRSIDQSRSG